MKNKNFIVFITLVITALCLYYLSFTIVSGRVRDQAISYATQVDGTINFIKKQQYLDSVWRLPVYKFLGANYTFKEVKETELGLGLDLLGGMHVTLEVSQAEIIKGLAGNPEDLKFQSAIANAVELAKTGNGNFVDYFYQSFTQELPNIPLSEFFANSANADRITINSTDSEILNIINAEVENALDRSFNILRTRIDRFGTSNPNIQRIQNSGRIQIELPGVDNPERVRKLLQGVAKLQFWEVYETSEIASTIENINSQLLASGITKSLPSSTQLDTSNLSDLEKELALTDSSQKLENKNSEFIELLQPGYGLSYLLKDTMRINQLLNSEHVAQVIPSNTKFLWAVKPISAQVGNEVLELYAIKTTRGEKAPLEGDVVTAAMQTLDQSSKPAVSMQMNAEGARQWKKLTGENQGRRIAIVLDNYVYTAPTVQGEIPGGNSEITGNFTIEEAKDLANILKAGALPAPTQIVEEAMIGPTLGQEAQFQGLSSMIAGLGIVVLFMLGYYARAGLVANVALIFNIFFILGILAQIGTALTLPGIAGIVLTIGMSIDANVLIFERIREERRNGKGLLESIKLGYNKAFSAILDSNATTLLIGAILYSIGQGPVKGFAVVLMIGIIASFFTAVYITRVILYFLTKKGEKSKINFETKLAFNQIKDLNFDFLGKRKIAYLFSSSIIGLGLILILFHGLKLGVDFTGGRSYIVGFTESVIPSELKVDLDNEFEGSVEVKTYGSSNTVKITTSYLVNESSNEADILVEDKLVSSLENITGFTFNENGASNIDDSFKIEGTSKVGASVADDIKSSSYKAIIWSLIAIFIYILIRFRKWEYSLASIIALIHDAMFVIAAFAIANSLGANFEIDQVFMAAILTVIGYSINDTVVVFDRIRERLQNHKSSQKTQVINEAINQTLSRTLITSFTTLVVVLVLLIFGGEVLRGFSFALFVGIIGGTFSSIFIASPIMVDLMKREVKKDAKAVHA
ncbi:protein translocase subunit SecDF [Peijinzhouia sedimentorum]